MSTAYGSANIKIKKIGETKEYNTRDILIYKKNVLKLNI